MTIKVGDKLPSATFSAGTPEGPRPMSTDDIFAGKKVALFAVPGAFTPTCSAKHLPGFKEHVADFKAKGVDAIACVSVNDAFVMKAWGEATGATATGITMLGDADASFTKAIGLTFDVPHLGFFARSKRYSLLAEDGVVTQFNPETGPGCEISAGEHLLSQL